MTSVPATHARALARAVALAERVAVTTSPNPNVGCVLVRDGVIVGEGATEPAGGRHAEVVALDAAGDAASGADALVTLEPCAHHGRTPPCSDALARAGVARVVFAHPDPHGPASGGAERLRARGVEVRALDVDEPLRWCVAAQLEGFLTAVTEGRPHVTLKLAQTADGSLTASPPARWITGPRARRAVHRWRAASDAVLVGSGTVLADDPGLDVREVAARVQPRPVVLDARLRTPPTARIVGRGALVLTAPDAPAVQRRALVAAGATVVTADPTAQGGLDPEAALRELARRGITRLFAEPGPRLARSLLAGGLVDRLVLHVALEAGTGPARRFAPGPDGGPWRTERAGGAGEDLVLHLVPTSTDGGQDPLEGGS